MGKDAAREIRQAFGRYEKRRHDVGASAARRERLPSRVEHRDWYGAHLDCHLVSLDRCLEGVLELRAGSVSSGWRKLAQGLGYRACAVRARVLDQNQKNRAIAAHTLAGSARVDLRVELNHAALLLCYFRVVGDSAASSHFAGLLDELLEPAYGLVPAEHLKLRVFEPFSAALNRGGGGDNPQHSSSCGSPYARVLESWCNLEPLAEALLECCEYHCRRMVLKDPKVEEEFVIRPFDVLPVDILAVFRVRSDLGLSTPVIQHPLLETPLAEIPSGIVFDPEPELAEVDAALKTELGW